MTDRREVANTAVIQITALTPESERLWRVVEDISRIFGLDEPWVLVGGLMVQLFSFEHDAITRPTTDIDVLGDARKLSMTKRMSDALIADGGTLSDPPRGQNSLAYTFDFHGATVEVLAPDGLKSRPRTVRGCTTIEVPGGTQALKRAEVVRVSVDGSRSFVVRRPNLLGAILMKARIVAKRRGKIDSDRRDLIQLLSFIDDPRNESRHLTATERGWLRKAKPALAFEDRSGLTDFDIEVLMHAEQAIRLLVGQPG